MIALFIFLVIAMPVLGFYGQVHTIGTIQEPQFTIHEVYYDEEGNPNSWTVDAVTPVGDDREELMASYLQMASAFIKPILSVEDDGSGEKLVEWTP